MNVLIAEDEPLASERLVALLKECEPTITITEQVDSVEGLVQFYQSGKAVDLLMLDIQLADGKSFEAFKKTEISTPIIFTTAYDQYAIQAFKHLSIDYLLKPIQKEDLQKALDKFKRISNPQTIGLDEVKMLNEFLRKSSLNYRERFLIKAGNKLQFKQVNETAYFYADGKATYLVTKKENRKHLIDHTLEDLESSLDPKQFFRISRRFIIHIDSILEVKGLMSSRLDIKLNQSCDQELSVSREKAKAFKSWLDR
jgi:DNA-binding LytR/AlgR family response regulator